MDGEGWSKWVRPAGKHWRSCYDQTGRKDRSAQYFHVTVTPLPPFPDALDYIYFEANREHLIGQLIKVTRQLLDENGFQDLLIIAGAGAQSTLEAIALSIDAANSGADHVIVLSPAYFATSITNEANESFYQEVLIPILSSDILMRSLYQRSRWQITPQFQ